MWLWLSVIPIHSKVHAAQFCLETISLWCHCPSVSTQVKTGTEIEIARQVKSFKAAADRLKADPVKAKAFFVKHGFITKSGKLTARYRA